MSQCCSTLPWSPFRENTDAMVIHTIRREFAAQQADARIKTRVSNKSSLMRDGFFHEVSTLQIVCACCTTLSKVLYYQLILTALTLTLTLTLTLPTPTSPSSHYFLRLGKSPALDPLWSPLG